MQTNKEIITEIIEDLEDTVGLNWPKRKDAKVTREKLIECWSDYRKESDWKFYGYTKCNSLSMASSKIFSNINKPKTTESWENFILKIYKYNHCSTCTNIINMKYFSNKGHECVICLHKRIQKNKNIYKEYYKEFNKEYNKLNKDKINAFTSKYKAAKLKRTPFWLTKEDYIEIQNYYRIAKKKELETGIKYHVDHIIPLQGKLVCGLHVPNNLQVITASQNMSKSNKFNI